MKKNDWILVSVIIGIALIISLFFIVTKKEGGRVVIKVDGEIYGTYSLYRDTTIEIRTENSSDFNELVIKNGTANMVYASCPDQLCVHQKEIKNQRESIVCLPNRVIVEVTGGKEAPLDAVVQ